MYKLLDGKMVAAEIKDNLKCDMKEYNLSATLVVVVVGDNPASKIYVNNKKKACENVGINSVEHLLPEDISEQNLIDFIDNLNSSDDIDGILVQLPLPKHINEHRVLESIDPKKDVDGFTRINTGGLWIGSGGLVPCTAMGIVKLLDYYNIDVAGKHCVIIGRSNIVGKPVAALMLEKNATVTMCHSKTKDISSFTKSADIIISAVGKPKFITNDMVKEGTVVIDVGINRDENGKLCGDVDFENVKNKASYITPVPGGVGPMTVAMLMENTVRAAISRENE